MTRSLSFCHGLFLVPCGMRNGRGSEPVQAVLQEAGQAGSKYGHAVGSLAPELQTPHRKQPTRPVQAHKLPVREREPGPNRGLRCSWEEVRCVLASGSCTARALRAAGISAHLGNGERRRWLRAPSAYKL